MNYTYFVTGCDVGMVDFAFVLDVSVSIKNDTNFGLIRNLVTQVASFLSIGIDQTLFSVMLFACHAWINFTIPEYTSTADLVNAVNNISYDDVSELNRTGTNIPEALNLLADAGSLGLRSNANYRHAVFITDGRANTRDLVETELGRRLNDSERQQLRQEDRENTISAARRLHDTGIFDDVSAIGIRGSHNINFEELGHIASRPELEFIIDDFTESAFQAVLQELSGEICERKQNYKF